MRCCVTFCKNSTKTNSKSPNVTFHKFPTDQFRRKSWLKSLGLAETSLSANLVVCSQHFKSVDFYVAKSGLKTVQRGILPIAAQFCMICLDTDTKLYPLSKYNLDGAYENITGLSLSSEVNYNMQTLCVECAQRLVNCNRFRERSLRAHTLLSELVTKHELLTIQDIKSINRENFQLTSNIIKKTYEPEHCDLYLIDYKEEDEEIELKKIVCNTTDNTEVKVEKLEPIRESKESTFKCDNESDEEFLNDDIDNDIEFVHNDVNVEVKNFKKDLDDELLSTNIKKLDVLTKKLIDDEIINDSNVKTSERINNSDIEIVNNKDSDTTKVSTKVNEVKPQKITVNKVRNRSVKPKVERKRKNSANCGLKLFTVTALSYEEQVAEVESRKDTTNYKKSYYTCDMCYKGFTSKVSYKRHMTKHTDKFGELECSLCKQHFKSRRLLHKHIMQCHSMRYNCTSCPYVTKRINAAQQHERWHKGTKYTCPQCGEEFNKKPAYFAHLRIKHPSDFVCALCGYSFVSERGLNLHMNLKHRFDDAKNPEGPVCEPCNIRFASEDAYEQHIKVSLKHSDEGTRVRNDYVIKRRYGKKSELACEQCGIQMKNFRLYTQHFRTVHPDKVRTRYAQTDKRSLCEQCGKIFPSPTLLRYHMAVHSGQKMFQCDVCQKRFVVQTQLALHKKIHSDARPSFDCTICGKSFTKQSNRDRHIWNHNGGKRLECDLCDRSFVYASEIRFHILHVHLKKPWPKRKNGPRVRASRARHAKEAVTLQNQ